jgi:hypothetical protein
MTKKDQEVDIDEPSTSTGRKRLGTPGHPGREEVHARRQKTKETMAEVARRRAAHFATFDEDGPASVDDNIHVGGDSARTLGPWSTAYQLAEAREDAKAKREESIMASGRNCQDPEEGYEYKHWTPKEKGVIASEVPRLKDRSMSLVTELIEYVESLWGIPDEVRSQLAVEVCKMRRMQDDAFKLFTSHAGTWISIPDCSYIEEEIFLQGLLDGMHSSLEALLLGLCGRGFTDQVATTLSSGASFKSLETLVLRGAYRLTDSGCIELLKNAKALKTLGMPHCSRIEGRVVERLKDLAPNLKSLDISWCCGIPGTCLAPACERLGQLEALYLNGIIDVDDAFLSSGALNGVTNLQVLSLAHCTHVTDSGLKSIAQHLENLHTIVLDQCNITSDGIESIVAGCPKLTNVSLKRCSGLKDDSMIHLVRQCEIQKLYLNGLKHLSGKFIEALILNRNKSLQEVDLSWCRSIPEQALGYLCDACPMLSKLILWGCNHVSKDFSLGIRNPNVKIIGVSDQSVTNPIECITR